MLIPEDFNTYIRETALDQITNNKDHYLKEVIYVAEREAMQYTEAHYDSNCLYPNLENLILDELYTEDEMFTYAGDIYTVKGATFSISDIDELESNTNIKIEDNRNRYLKMILIDIALYHIHSRISPHQIPELRVIRYDQAIDKLGNIKTGVFGGLGTNCRKTDEEGNITNILWGGQQKINFRY